MTHHDSSNANPDGSINTTAKSGYTEDNSVRKSIKERGNIETGDSKDGKAMGGSGTGYGGSITVTAKIFIDRSRDQAFFDGVDWSKIRDLSRDDFLHVDLAPSYGQLSRESVKLMDENLKVMIAGTVRMIQRMAPEQRQWKAVESAFLNNPLVEPFGDPIHRRDTLIKNALNLFKVNGAPDSAIVKEVESWFHNLINDSDVITATPTPITDLAKIVAWSGATITDFETAIYKTERHEKTVVDIGILRFPDITYPYFKVYHIKLNAWSRSDRVLAVQNDSNGIEGEFYSRKFRPREEVIGRMKQEAVKQAVAEVEALFD